MYIHIYTYIYIYREREIRGIEVADRISGFSTFRLSAYVSIRQHTSYVSIRRWQ